MPVLDFQRVREAVLPEWTKPENASVFDPFYRAPIRTIINALGLDDPQQVMALGTPLETGQMAGGALEAIGKRFPRFADALRATHGSQFHGSPKSLDTLRAGSMFSNDPVWAAGYTTQFDPFGRESFSGAGAIHTLDIPQGKTIPSRTVHHAEEILLNEGRRFLGREPSNLNEAAKAVHEATGATAIVAEGGRGGILLVDSPVKSQVNPVSALHEALATGREIPRNLADVLPSQEK